jgi:hypothetical protein
MTYSDFISIAQVEEHFQITVASVKAMFDDVEGVALPAHYAATLDENTRLAIAINNEKSRSEFIIAPLLVEAWRMCKSTVSLFSGVELKVSPETGLSGRCDFLFSASSEMMFLRAPILTVVEAKNDNVQSGFAQCIAEMVAAAQFNEEHGQRISPIFGCCTTGTEWRFLRFAHGVVSIDLDDYFIADAAKILGIVLSIIQQPQLLPHQ